MAQHTPGPWHIGAGNGEGSVFAAEGRMRMEQGGTTLYPICTVTTGWKAQEDDANARLIAAAPTLLAALDECAALLDNYATQAGARTEDSVVRVLAAADAAIAAARGQS